MHKANYEDRIEIQTCNGKQYIVHIVTAYWYDHAKNTGHSLDIYKEDENGNCSCRNLYYSSYTGYVVAFPGLPYDRYYYGDEIAQVEEWHEFKHHEFFCSRNKLTQEEENKLIFLHPDFKYVLKKWEGTISEIMLVLPLWIKHPEIELLLATGFEKVALNKNFYRLRDENKKKIIKWIQKWPEYKEFTLQQIQIVVKNNLNEKQYAEYIHFLNTVPGSHGCKYETFSYLKKHNIANSLNLSLYRDYISLVKQTEHNLKENYWLYPSDLEEAHAKVLEEVNIIKKTREEKERKELENNLKEITNKASEFNTEINGYDIFVTNNMDIWEKQADKLHQCIIRCHYVEMMARGDLILVFIQKKGVPVATAEIRKDMTLGQFYADEHSGSRDRSRPTKEVQDVFQKYFETLNKKIFKKKKVQYA